MMARVLIPLSVLLAAVLLWRSCFSVAEGEVALRTRFGQIEGGTYQAGLHFKSPFDEVHRFDRRILTHVYPGESFQTRDQKSLIVDFYIKWQLLDARLYYQSTRGGDESIAAQQLIDLVRDRMKTAVASQPLATVISQPRGSLNQAGFVDINSAANQLGMQLIDLGLSRVDLTDDVANSVYQRMQQSLLAKAQEMRAAGTADAEKVRADAERKRAEILADANRESQRIRGEGDARAAAAYARAYGRNPEFAAFYRSLQAYKNVIGRDGDILVITPEGEFFKYLHSDTGR